MHPPRIKLTNSYSYQNNKVLCQETYMDLYHFNIFNYFAHKIFYTKAVIEGKIISQLSGIRFIILVNGIQTWNNQLNKILFGK